MERSFLEVRRIDGKNLPACHLVAQQLDGSHIGKLRTQTGMMIMGGGQPDSIVGGVCELVAKDENDLVTNVNGEAAEHRTGPRRKRRERIDDEFMRDALSWLDREQSVIQRKRSRVATGLGHQIPGPGSGRTDCKSSWLTVAILERFLAPPEKALRPA